MANKIIKFILSLFVFQLSWGIYSVLSGLFFWGISSIFNLTGKGWFVLLWAFPCVIGMVSSIYHALQFSERYGRHKEELTKKILLFNVFHQILILKGYYFLITSEVPIITCMNSHRSTLRF